MDSHTMRIAAFGITGALLAGVSAWLHVKTKGESGSGWGFWAIIFLFASFFQS
ncbi:hypothetical protein [Pseudodesulfovibrio pelocollis]|uniref:hypothetical protein n=1 Tax=Pseudodesulfovibrio pelocollis TaxID=3051432 RepID=UPI00255A71C7|nr:hypothetical protein [Pseudodesulfovibrio sp. SB368]